ncbi:hypothetical protein STEG23_024558 [Scotinomys teguina]
MTQIDLTDIYRTFHPNTKEYTFLAPHKIFSKIDHTLGHKANLNKYEKIGITPCIFIGVPWDKVRIQQQHKLQKSYTLYYHWIKKEIKKQIKDILEFNENESTTYPNLWDTMKTVLIGKFIALNAHINKMEKSHTSDLTAHLKALKLIQQE